MSRTRRPLPLWSLVALAAGCTAPPAGRTPPARGASAELHDVQGQFAGGAELTAWGSDSTMVAVSASVASNRPRGVHLHAVGRCDGPDFATAGGHLNPYAREHGRRNPRGAHAGDLPNLPAAGTSVFALAVPFDAIMDADGSTVIVHANVDDEMTDPSGNSGARLLCGVLRPATARRRAP